MNKYEISNLGVFVYHEKLDNGLNVFLIPYEDKSKFYMSFGTKFGSIDTSFAPLHEKEIRSFPYGIAHFLEHKMFEQESGEPPFEFFSKMGSNVNASTTFDNTRYVVYGTKSFNENLDYLLDFVMSPYFTDENVLKEKGIIAEEIKMYDDDPDWVIDTTSRQAVFSELPYRIDIAGTIESIDAITKKDLYDCYNTFYNPNNMIMIATGDFNYEEALSIIKNNKSINKTINKDMVIKGKYNELDNVYVHEKVIYLDVEIPKVNYTLKLLRKDFPIDDDYQLDMYLGMILGIIFGSSSNFREKMRVNNLMTAFNFSRTFVDKFIIIEFSFESEVYKKAINELKKTLKNIKITSEEMTRMKKVWVSSEVKMIDNITLILDNMYSDFINFGRIFPNKIGDMRELEYETLNTLISKINVNNSSLIIALPKKKM